MAKFGFLCIDEMALLSIKEMLEKNVRYGKNYGKRE